MTDEGSADLSGVELFETLADSRVFQQACWRGGEGPGSARRCRLIDRRQEVVKPPKVRPSLRGPPKGLTLNNRFIA